MNLNISAWPAGARPDRDRRRIHPVDPPQPLTSGSYAGGKILKLHISRRASQPVTHESQRGTIHRYLGLFRKIFLV
jgi:hypothetical protein